MCNLLNHDSFFSEAKCNKLDITFRMRSKFNRTASYNFTMRMTKDKNKTKSGRGVYRKDQSSCSCSTGSSTDGNNCSCSCCCSTSPSCSSDSDDRFAKYYQLSSDEAELRGIDFPAETKKKRKGMVKLLLHTMVMWSDIWQTRNGDEDSASSSDGEAQNINSRKNSKLKAKVMINETTSDSDEEKDSDSDDRDDKTLGHLANQRRKKYTPRPYSGLPTHNVSKVDHSTKRRKTEVEDEQTAEKRLRQALDMKEDTGHQFFSGKWYGQPLEELDPYIYDDTFCILSWRPKGPCVVYRYFKGDTVGLFAPDHPARTFAFKFVTHRYFGRLIVLTVFANCVTLALERFEYDEFGMRINSKSSLINEILELLYLIIYTIEMVLKIIAKGFIFQRLAYLRSGWNVLDFIVVVSSYIGIFTQLALKDFQYADTRVQFLRIFRVLRAIKTISILPSLRKIVNSLINSSALLFEVMGLTLFVIMILSLFGMELFGGKFRQKCVRIQGVTNEDDMDPEFRGITQGLSTYMTNRLYGMWIENAHNWLYRDAPDSEPTPCGNGTSARACPDGYVCLEVGSSENPNNGWISFDTFHLAAMQTLQVMTLDYWDRIYEFGLSTVGRESIFFFALVIFFGGYYLLNLMLAVVTLSYEKEIGALDLNYGKIPVPRRLELTRNVSSFNFEHLSHQRLRLFEGFRRRPLKERDELLIRMVKADEYSHPVMKHRFETSEQYTPAVYKLLSKTGRYKYVRKSLMELQKLAASNIHRMPLPDDKCYDEFQLFDEGSDIELVDENDDACLKLKNGKFCNCELAGFDQNFMVQDMAKFVTRPVNNLQFNLYPDETRWESLQVWLSVWRNAIKPLVEDWKWRNLMTLCIFINTVISCFEHHGQPDWLDHLIYLSNDVFTYVFCVELLLKVVAYQSRFFEYGWNKFDLFVVVGSILDTILQISLGYKGLRGLKLLRILKLAQAWDTLKIMLNILISAMGDMANLLLILFIAIYIFAVFGMQYIGSGYDPKSFRADFYPANYPRWAWQTFVHSFLMVFRVVCGEWVELISECLEAYKPQNNQYKCFLTFIPTLIFGNFIVLNLFLALLLHIFDAAELNTTKKNVKANRRNREEASLRAHIGRLWKRLKERLSKQKEEKVNVNVKRVRPRLKKLNKVNPEETDDKLRLSRVHLDLESQHQDFIPDHTMLITKISDSESNALYRINPSLTVSSENLDNVESKAELDYIINDELKELGDSTFRRNRFSIVRPRYPLPKWRFYEIVVKYWELVSGGVDIDEDSDLEDSDMLTGINYYEIPTSSEETTFQNDLKGKDKFREIVYRVIMGQRRSKAEMAIKNYVESKKKELRAGCVAGVIDQHTTLNTVEYNEMEHGEHQIIQLPSCFPKSWYSNWKFFLCWLWGTKKVPWLDRYRLKAYSIIHNPYFEWGVLVVICASSIFLCFEDIHLDSNPALKDFLFYAAVFSTSVFVVEFLLKIFADGIYTYFTNPWSILDFLLVLIGITSITAEILVLSGSSSASISHLSSLKVLRTLKALRPLRAISRWQGMKMVVNSLIQAIPAISNVFCVCLVFWLVFAIMGVQFFKGRFYKCVNEIGEIVDATVAPNKQVCCQKTTSFNFAWINSFPNFDSVPEAYIALLYLATFEGWIEVIRAATDARDIDQQPVRDYDLYANIYFVTFCLVGGFLTTNLFIGVIIDNFNVLKKKFEGNLYEALMTPTQLRYYWSIKRLGKKQQQIVLPIPRNPARLAFFEIATSPRSEFVMFIIVLMNMVLMCCDGYKNGLVFDSALESLAAFFIFIYALETAVKLIGLGSYFFKSAWNIFDLIILIITVVDYVIGDLLSRSFPVPPSMVRLCRILRVGRIMRLMKSAKGIRRLVVALLVSLPALFNVGALLLLVIFIYSILGMSLFGRIGYGASFDEITNFETFPNSFLLLFRLTSGAGWNDILESLTSTETYCGDPDEDDCGGPGEPECSHWIASLIFIVSFLIITNFVIVNMYIAVILENYAQATEQDELDVTADDIDTFLAKWAVFDGEAIQFLELKYLSPFLNSLEPPLRMKYPNQISITALDIPIYDGQVVHVLDVMRSLMVFVLGHAETQQMEEIQSIINIRFAERFRQKKVLPLVSTTRIWKIHHNAAICIQRFWRKNLKTKRKRNSKGANTHFSYMRRKYGQRRISSKHVDLNDEEATIE